MWAWRSGPGILPEKLDETLVSKNDRLAIIESNNRNESIEYQLFSSVGLLIQSEKIYPEHNNLFIISTKGLINGIYYLKLQGKEGVELVQIIIQH